MPDSGSAVESPLDRLRRLAKESKAVKPDRVDAPGPEEPATASAEAVTMEPASVEPSFRHSTADEPSFEERSFEQPSFEQPSFEQPSFEQPSFEEPSFDEPAFVEPVSAALAEAPATEVPVLEVPAGGSVEEPAATTSNAVVPAEVVAPPSERPDPPAAARRSEPALDETPVAAPAAAAVDDGPVAPAAVPAQTRSAAPGRLVAATGVLGLFVVLAIVGLILAIHHERSSNKPASERAAATAAAIKVVADTTTFDYRNANDWLRRVQADSTDGSTPGKGLRTDFGNQKDLLAQATATDKSVAVGKVVSSVYCGGQCASSQVAGDTAAALVYVASTVTSTATPAGVTSKTRFTVKLIKVNGIWLATNEDPVAAAATS